jgi:tetratricopeptide (TPR) repeat protein
MRTILMLTFLLIVLLETPANSQSITILPYYSPKLPDKEMNEVKSNLARIMKETKCNDENRAIYYSSTPKNVDVFDDRIEIFFKNHSSSFKFSDLLNQNIVVFYAEYAPGMLARNYYQLSIGKLIFYCFSSGLDSFKEMADYLRFFQNQQFNSQFALFEPIAQKYRALAVKPKVSEEQRKLIVQANGFNEQKMYDKAVELYQKAIESDQTAYPAAYSNLALLSAQLNHFSAAIYFMKKYLMLEPEASDSRSALDKIYLWEAQLNQ